MILRGGDEKDQRTIKHQTHTILREVMGERKIAITRAIENKDEGDETIKSILPAQSLLHTDISLILLFRSFG